MIMENEKEKLKERLLFSEGNLHVYADITKKEFPELYEKIRAISEKAFKIPNAYDRFDETYRYLVCIAEYSIPGDIHFDNEKKWEVVSFYRYIPCKDAFTEEEPNFDLSTSNFYEYTTRFKTLLPVTLELGRSVVNPDAKASNGLLTIWKGLGCLIEHYSKNNIQYLFGEVSLQKSIYDIENLFENDALLSIVSCFIMNFYNEDFIIPKNEMDGFSKAELLQFAKIKGFEGRDFSKDSNRLKKILKDKELERPHLFFYYTNLVNGKGINMFLPVDNKLLNCFEMGILLKISQIDKVRLARYKPKNGYRQEAFM